MQQEYTSLDQQADEWDSWEDGEPRVESGMFVAYRPLAVSKWSWFIFVESENAALRTMSFNHRP